MTWQNEPLSALTHFLGALLAVTALVLLVLTASLNGTTTHVVTYTIFASTMILLYTMSTVFHFICSTKLGLKKVFQILDHVSIYLLIAGTYTPVALLALPTAWGWSIFGVIWGLAFVGILTETLPLKLPKWFPSALYLIMGWLIVVAYHKLSITPEGEFWLILGGVFYTIGAFFFALDSFIKRTRWFGTHEVFHIFVMLGSFSHFWLLYHFLI